MSINKDYAKLNTQYLNTNQGCNCCRNINQAAYSPFGIFGTLPSIQQPFANNFFNPFGFFSGFSPMSFSFNGLPWIDFSSIDFSKFMPAFPSFSIPSFDFSAFKIPTFNISGTKSIQNNSAKTGDIWNGRRITSPFGKRTAPTKGATTDHKGVDLAYSLNEEIGAFSSGTVVKVAEDANGLGKYVDIKDDNGITHRYGHANEIKVKVGDKITKGDIIALAGQTGIATGPHLHYAKIKNGEFINPIESSNV